MFSGLCSSANSGNTLATIDTFLSIYQDVVKGTSAAAFLAAARNGKTPVDALSVDRAKSAKLWVDAALSTGLEVVNLVSCIADGHPNLHLSERAALLATQIGKSEKGHCQTLELADSLQHEMQGWFLRFVEEAVSVGFCVLGEGKSDDKEASTGKENGGIATVLCLKRVSDWLDVVGKKPDEEMVVEKIEQLKRKICNFVITQVGSAFDNAISLGRR